ncbi:MAG: cobalt-precorrin-6A reductase [Pseudooceanicola sp.]|jgi:precorrin-6A/cobalt-precorrin-6A reductase|nr:cobalt-precorrin-6A reductase [Pseudooceanicola sp.]
MAQHILVLGGTTEATALAQAISDAGLRAVFSYAGRVADPKAQPLPTRVGGFGGAEAMANWLRDTGITHVVDATHPFAAGISANAVAACAACNIPLLALTRRPWEAEPGDTWQHVPDIPAAVAALEGPTRRVMLAIGRMHLDAFAAQPGHFYLLRLVDAPDGPLPLPDCAVEVSRGPFTVEQDTALMQRHGIELVVAKNAGGSGARAKVDAARALSIPMLMIDRPALPQRAEVHDIDAVFDWLAHSGTDLGV